MKPNGKEADMSATVIPISNHPRYTATPAERELERIITDHKTAGAALAATTPTPAPDPIRSRYLTCAETAKLVRGALKRAFPGVKFRVRSSTYSMGASIRVTWIDGPESEAVRKIAGIYAGADFDGTIDLKTHYDHWLMPDGSVIVAAGAGTTGSGGCIPGVRNSKPNPDAELVSMGADYIFCNRSTSKEA